MSQVSVKVNILEREYQVMCDEAERDALLSAAQNLNNRMRDIRSTGRIVGGERIAVMTALNLVHEQMSHKDEQTVAEQALASRLRGLGTSIDITLERIRENEKAGT